ncbi:hypothetical protein LTR04_004516 [Oleoguttula sp. CCFEE 6159]|nr:hypothetical protein LTR04_004516 [Oleoguttula sp. CCFEE 6159]
MINLASSILSYIRDSLEPPKTQAHPPLGALQSAIAALKSTLGFTQQPSLATSSSASPQHYLAEGINFLLSRTREEYIAALLAVLAFIVTAMSWSSRFGNLTSRLSPFGRPGQGQSSQVNDGDFSYITSDDLKNQQQPPNATSQPYQSSHTRPSGPPRDTDVLVLKNKRVSYPVHFPAYSIERGELTVGRVREEAAKKAGAGDPRRVKLFYKGQNLADDTRTCASQGLRTNGEILCVLGDAVPEPADHSSSSDDSGVDVDGAAAGDAPKRKRNRTRNKKKKNQSKKSSGTATPTTSDSLPLPHSSSNPSSRPRSPAPPATPATAMDKLNALSSTLAILLPQCAQYTASPPSDPAKRDFEHKRLSETILAQVLLKLDAVETEGDAEARARRKELVREAQNVLNGLDAAVR